MERVGIPTAHVCSIVPVALMVGSNRIVSGSKIVNPLGNAELEFQDEKKMRKGIVEKALQALKKDVDEQEVFD